MTSRPRRLESSAIPLSEPPGAHIVTKQVTQTRYVLGNSMLLKQDHKVLGHNLSAKIRKRFSFPFLYPRVDHYFTVSRINTNNYDK